MPIESRRGNHYGFGVVNSSHAQVPHRLHHGFNSSITCWDPLITLLLQDPGMTAAFDWLCFSYDSKVTKGLLNPLYRIPDFPNITRDLDQF